MIGLILGALFGGALCAVIAIAEAYLLAMWSGGRVDLFSAFVVAAWMFGPAVFGVGVAASYYVIRYAATREPVWRLPLGISSAVLLAILVWEGAYVLKGQL